MKKLMLGLLAAFVATAEAANKLYLPANVYLENEQKSIGSLVRYVRYQDDWFKDLSSGERECSVSLSNGLKVVKWGYAKSQTSISWEDLGQSGTNIIWTYRSDMSNVYLRPWLEWLHYSLSYNANGGSGSMEGQGDVRYDTKVLLPSCEFTKTGYSFAGWSVEETGGTVWQDGSSCDGYDFGVAAQNHDYGKDAKGTPVILYAQWTPVGPVVVPQPHDNSTAKVYTNGVEVTGESIVVLSNAMVDVVFEADSGYCFADDHSTTRTNTVEATNDPTEVVGPDVVKIPLMSVEVAQQAEWGISLKSGDQEISPEDYAYACSFYGLTQKTVPQVVPEGCVAVTKESIAAAKAMTVQIVNGQVALGVSVCSNADITASTANWAPVKFTKDTQIGLSADGTKLILPIPVAAQQGFMILQSGDAKVSEGGVRVPVTGKPWYTPTVED